MNGRTETKKEQEKAAAQNRIKNVRINQMPEKKEQEKKSNQASKLNSQRNKEAIDHVAFREVENISKVCPYFRNFEEF